MELFRLFGSIGLNDAQARQGLRNIDSQAENTSSRLGAVGKIGGLMGKAIAVGATAAVSGLTILKGFILKTGIEYDAMVEQSTVAWTTLLGTQGEAKKMLKDIADFAKATPFETEQVDIMAKYMHNAGLEGKGLFDALMKVSDVASAFNIPAEEAQELTRQMSQVRQAGVAYTEDLNVLQDRGVPIYKAISEQLGITIADVKKMASEGKLSSDIYIKAFDGVANSVKGASDAQSKTFNGLLSTLSDNLKMISGQLGKGAFNALKGTLEAVMPIVERFSSTLKDKGLQEALIGLFPPSMQETVKNVMTSFDKIREGISGIFALFAGNTGGGISMLSRIGLSSDTITTVVTIVGNIKTTLKNLIGTVINGWTEIFSWVTNAWETVKALFSGDSSLGQSFSKIFSTIKSIVIPILADVIAFVKEKIAMIKQFWDENGVQIIQAVQNAWAVIAAVFQFIAPVILFIIKMLWDNVKGVIDGALKIIMGLIKVFAGLFTGDWSKMWEGIKQLLGGALQAAWNLINLMMFGKILGGIKSFVTSGIGWFKGLWTKTVEIFKSMSDGSLSTVSGMFTKVKSVFQGIYDTARTIFSKIKDAITHPIETAKTVVGKAIDAIKGFFRNMTSKIKMPHFAIAWNSVSAFGKTIKYPKGFDVNWYARGTNFAPGGYAMVGENGPELINLPRGSKVKTANETDQMLNKNGGVQHLTVEAPIILDGYEIGKAIFTTIDLMQTNNFSTRKVLSGVKW